MSTTTNTGCGVGSPAFILFIVFLIMKLAGTITWSWCWVTCPLWAGAAIVIGIWIIIGIIALLAYIAKS